ncbi:MAG: hypothetical protein GQ570_11875 [Helicobacteraceae bacterium]|nr:hypothetical protein [Helicobacteraceae bacterium]
MASNDALFTTLIQGLAELNRRVSEEEATSEEIILELKAFEEEYSKEIKIINDRLDGSAVLVDRLVRDAIKSLPKPQDPKEIDYSVVRDFLTTEINTLTKSRALETKNIKDEIIKLVSDIEIPKDGVDGKNATDSQVSNAVSKWILDNINLLKGEKGQDGKSIRGLDGKSGESGQDGISITDIKVEKEYLVITLSDDTEKRIKLPKQKVLVGGGSSKQTAKDVPYNNIDSDLTSTNVKSALDELSQASGGVSDLVFKKRTEIEAMFDSAKTTAYTTLTRVDGNITKIEVHEDITKVVHLFTKEINYVNGAVSQTLITRIVTGETLTKNLIYLGSDIVNTVVVYSA